jgi:translation initiation factor 3 subunit B
MEDSGMDTVNEFSTAIIVDGLPVVPEAKVEKLSGVLFKIYDQLSSNFSRDDIFMPLGPEGTTLGFCFIQFSTAEEATNARIRTQGAELGKSNKLNISPYSDMDKMLQYSEEFQAPPEIAPPKPLPDPASWLNDSECRDQYVTRYGLETEIAFASAQPATEVQPVYCGEREKEAGRHWCESYVTWSPQGSYMATFHGPGIKLWGGENFEAFGRYMHSGVEELRFSPCERYMTTYRIYDQSEGHTTPPVIVWDVRNGTILRTFDLRNPLDVKFQVNIVVTEEKGKDLNLKRIDRICRGRIIAVNHNDGMFTVREDGTDHVVPGDKVQALQDPNRLKWSPDGNYLAKMGPDIITIYTLPSMTILDKKSLATKDVLDFSWSPNSNMISYYVPAEGNKPALINILEIPSRRDVCSRKVFDVVDGRMTWQSDGDYLCAHMAKVQGKKRSFVVMLFRIREALVPVELVEITEPIIGISWEPGADRFVIAHGDPSKATLAVYSMVGDQNATTEAPRKGKGKGPSPSAKKECTLLYTLQDKKCSDVIWSPAGGVAAFAYFTPDGCQFELYDIEANNSLASRRHDRSKRLVWDPSGRIIASYTTRDLRDPSRATTDDGFNLYTFQGALICGNKRERLHQLQWRPRPKNLLSPEEKKAVIKNLRKYEKEFEKEDRARRSEENAAVLEMRRGQASAFLTLLAERQRTNRALKADRIALRDGYDSDDDANYEIKIDVQETILSSKEQVIH